MLVRSLASSKAPSSMPPLSLIVFSEVFTSISNRRHASHVARWASNRSDACRSAAPWSLISTAISKPSQPFMVPPLGSFSAGKGRILHFRNQGGPGRSAGDPALVVPGRLQREGLLGQMQGREGVHHH